MQVAPKISYLQEQSTYAESHISIFVRNASWLCKQGDPPSPTPCHMRHSQNFDKIDSFLKPVLNIFIPCNLMQAGGGDCKRGGW